MAGWLTSVGGVTVERITDCKRSFTPANASPPKAVLHTTEGGWTSSLNVFRYNTGTPTFMIGRDGSTKLPSGIGYNGRLRLAQFMPIGEMALSLKNGSGGAETNRDCIVQIELVAFCQWTPWLPDIETTALLKALMQKLAVEVDIPLRRGGDDSRSVSRWINNAGWFGHGEVPENDHTDPRKIKWNSLLVGEVQEDIVFPPWFAPWKKWYMVSRPKGVPMPPIPGLPDPIPQWAYDDVGDSAEIHRLLGPPTQYQNWRNGRLIDTPMPENLPTPIPQWWWDGAVVDHKFANDYADKADDPLQAELATKIQAIVSLQNELASVRHELELAKQSGSAELTALELRVSEVKQMLDAAVAKLNET